MRLDPIKAFVGAVVLSAVVCQLLGWIPPIGAAYR